jgi:hypothetical protein
MVISIWLISRLKMTELSEIQCQSRFPYTGSRGHDDQLARVETVGEVVQVGEAGGHTGESGPAGLDGLHLVEGRLHQLRQRLEVLRRPTVGYRVHLGLGPVDDLVDVALPRVRHLTDPDRRVDQPAQHRLLADDLRVPSGVGRDRHRGQQGVQVGSATDPEQLAALAELVGHGDRVGRLAAAVEVGDGVVDLLVGRPVEVRAADRLHHVRDGVLAHQHGAEHALLGLHVLRRRTVGQLGGAVPVGRHHLGQAHESPSLLSYRFGSESNVSSEPTGTG